jgi:hypothetical protein
MTQQGRQGRLKEIRKRHNIGNDSSIISFAEKHDSGCQDPQASCGNRGSKEHVADGS